MAEENYNRFANWQGVTREQLGATSNLVLGLATGLLGFATVLLLEKKLVVLCVVAFGVAASALLALSVALALWCATNRLTDFRLTAQIANPKNNGSPQLEEFRHFVVVPHQPRSLARTFGEAHRRYTRMSISVRVGEVNCGREFKQSLSHAG
ncbi:MAG: hypothetical protein WD688_16355 [Candidatus Binatia bacterium]